jgi:hypothetical protein
LKRMSVGYSHGFLDGLERGYYVNRGRHPVL